MISIKVFLESSIAGVLRLPFQKTSKSFPGEQETPALYSEVRLSLVHAEVCTEDC